jgi:hypothetical protein
MTPDDQSGVISGGVMAMKHMKLLRQYSSSSIGTIKLS